MEINVSAAANKARLHSDAISLPPACVTVREEQAVFANDGPESLKAKCDDEEILSLKRDDSFIAKRSFVSVVVVVTSRLKKSLTKHRAFFCLDFRFDLLPLLASCEVSNSRSEESLILAPCGNNKNTCRGQC